MGMAAFSSWSNLIPTIAPPAVWSDIVKHSADMEDLRRIIGRAVEDVAAEQAVEINTFHLTDNMLKDVIKLDLMPGGGLPVWSNLQHGVCILNMLPKSAEQISVSQRVEDNCWETMATRTFADTQRQNKADPQIPENTYESLKKNITTYRMYLFALYGQNCQHYKGVWAIHRILSYHLTTKITSGTSQSSTAMR